MARTSFQHPGHTVGTAAGDPAYDATQTVYAALGSPKTLTAQAGNEVALGFDLAGRLASRSYLSTIEDRRQSVDLKCGNC